MEYCLTIMWTDRMVLHKLQDKVYFLVSLNEVLFWAMHLHNFYFKKIGQ